jgi:hypothetical protein
MIFKRAVLNANAAFNKGSNKKWNVGISKLKISLYIAVWNQSKRTLQKFTLAKQSLLLVYFGPRILTVLWGRKYNTQRCPDASRRLTDAARGSCARNFFFLFLCIEQKKVYGWAAEFAKPWATVKTVRVWFPAGTTIWKGESCL